MQLYLVQHAEAKSKDEDPERPLTDRGRAEIQAVAAFVAKHGDVQARRILHSGKARARQTANALAEALHPPEGLQDREGLRPLDDPGVLAEWLEGAQEDLVIVGHLPHLAKLAGWLLCGDPDRRPVAFRMGGVVALERDPEGAWSCRWILPPDLLPR